MSGRIGRTPRDSNNLAPYITQVAMGSRRASRLRNDYPTRDGPGCATTSTSATCRGAPQGAQELRKGREWPCTPGHGQRVFGLEMLRAFERVAGADSAPVRWRAVPGTSRKRGPIPPAHAPARLVRAARARRDGAPIPGVADQNPNGYQANPPPRDPIPCLALPAHARGPGASPAPTTPAAGPPAMSAHGAAAIRAARLNGSYSSMAVSTSRRGAAQRRPDFVRSTQGRRSARRANRSPVLVGSGSLWSVRGCSSGTPPTCGHGWPARRAGDGDVFAVTSIPARSPLGLLLRITAEAHP